MSRWEQMFLPMRLRDHLESVKVIGADGVERPVVKSTRVLSEGGRWPVPVRPANWTLGYLMVGLVLGGLLAWLGRRHRWPFIALATFWALMAGVFGAILTYLWAFTNHVAAHNNENLFLFNLLALALAVTLPSAVRGKAWAVKPARRLALVIAALAALGFLLKLLPAFYQSNLDLIALALPAHLGVLAGLRSPEPS
jgi:peptidoglycan/LPS O-acetylase OafA/YrhL